MHQARHFQTLMDSIESVIIEADASTWELAFVSQEALNLLGYLAEQWFRPGFWVGRVHPADLGEFKRTMA
ncbi:hypothetical protein [Thiohalorhabdus sp.]|uniref:hypothetical protein n=1 Tax=Thiohalorhabdus sp. TaxID=3094134 RepID=UPI002FC3965D